MSTIISTNRSCISIIIETKHTGALEPGCQDCVFRDMLLGRAIGGIGNGFILSTVPIYVSELAPAHFRGATVTLFQLFITIGIFFSSCLNIWASTVDNGWRISLGIQAIPCIIMAFGVVLLLPASPRFLANRGREDDALEVLVRLNKSKQLSQGEQRNIATVELAEIQEELREIRSTGSLSWSQVFKGAALTSVLCGAGIAMTQNITAVNYFMNYAPSIINQVSYSSSLSIHCYDL